VAAFEYVVLDQKGKQQKGVLEGDSARQVRQQLRDKGYAPLSVEETVQKQNKQTGFSFSAGGSLSSSELALITRQLSTLVQSGLPLEETLKAVSQQTEQQKTRNMMMAIRAKVLEGHTLANAMGEYPKAFSSLFRATVAAGEHAGHLDLVLNRLADYTEARQQTQQKVQLAMLYPAILTFVAIGIVIFLLANVVPEIVGVFAKSGQELPWLTKGLIATSDFIVNYWAWLLLVIIVVIISIKTALKREPIRKRLHKFFLNFILTRKFSRGINAARFASTLSILTSSGVPLVEAIKIAGAVLSNLCLKESVAKASQRVTEGASLKASLDECGFFPPMMLHMIASGEASGELDDMLERTALYQDREIANLVDTATGLFEPIMLLLMAGIVLVIVMAIMMPIMEFNQLV